MRAKRRASRLGGAGAIWGGLQAAVWSILAVAGAGRALADGFTDATFVVLDYKQLSQLESQAEAARQEFWRGHYSEAAEAFQLLAATNHASAALYLCELGLCQWARGDLEAASRCLRDATQIEELFTRQDLEKKALSNFGREAEKVYRGDPYERACADLLLALLFLDLGDHDNALAACKSGLLADSDATENRYDSDFTLLYLAEAKCHLLRGEADAAAPAFEKARQVYRTTHPKLRHLFSARQHSAEMLKLTKKERKKLGVLEEDAALQAKIQQLDEQLQEQSAQVDADRELGALLTGQYNTLLIIPQGKSPRKIRLGAEADVVLFDVNHSRFALPQISLDGRVPACLFATNAADVQFQATTRGGREMDRILKGKAAFKTTTVSIGRSLTEAGSQSGGLGGLAVALVGAAIQGMGGAVTPEADTRCWRTLPAEYLVFPLTLTPGEHEVVFRQAVYFENAAPVRRAFKITGPADCRVLLAPPSLAEKYSASALLDRSKAKQPATVSQGGEARTNCPILLPPTLGLAQIEKFPSQDQAKRPRAFAPDTGEVARRLQQVLHKNGFEAQTIGHQEAMRRNPPLSGCSRAVLQCELLGLDLKVNGKTETFISDLEFVLVDSKTGERVQARRLTGRCERKGNIECGEAFYATVEAAASELTCDVSFATAAKQLASQNINQTPEARAP